MSNRRRLSNRRSHISFEFDHHNAHYTCGLGFFDDGSVAEIFLNGTKVDSDQDVNARDAAIAASIALQYGCPALMLAHSLSRDADGRPSSPLGVVMQKIALTEKIS